jgi:hypothetical protein
LHKFYFQSSLCRICLLEKEVTISLFENVTIDDKGVIENSKGPKAVRYNILPALKTLLDVQVKPDIMQYQHLCIYEVIDFLLKLCFDVSSGGSWRWSAK